MRHISPLKVLLPLFALLGLSVACLAGSQVPFHLEATVTSITPPVFVGSHMYFTASGTGSATHMGTMTFTAPHDFDLVAGTYVSDAYVSAANGDVLHLVTNAHFINAVDSVGTWVAAGGTGRFAHASGSGSAVNLNFGAQITYDGTISSVGSGK